MSHSIRLMQPLFLRLFGFPFLLHKLKWRMVKMTDQVRLAKIGWFDSLWCVHVYMYDIMYVFITREWSHLWVNKRVTLANQGLEVCGNARTYGWLLLGYGGNPRGIPHDLQRRRTTKAWPLCWTDLENPKRLSQAPNLGGSWDLSTKQMGVSENVVYPNKPNGFADHYPY